MGFRDDFESYKESFAKAKKKMQPFVPYIKGFLIYGVYLVTVSFAVTNFRGAFHTAFSGAIDGYGAWLALSCFAFTVAILHSGILTFSMHSKSEHEDFCERNPLEYDPRAEKKYILHSKFFWKEMLVIGVMLLLHPLEWSYDVLFGFHPIAESLPYLVKKLIVFAVYASITLLLSISARMEARKAWGVISKDLYKDRLWKSITEKKNRRFGYRRMTLRLLFNFIVYLIAGNYLPIALALVFSIAGIVSVLLTLSGTVITIIVLIVCLFYLRAILKRAKFIRQLKKTCREYGYELFDLKRPYRSIFRDIHRHTLGIEGHGKIYYCRLIASVKRGNHITFSHDGSCFRTFTLRLPTPRVAVRGRIVNMEESTEPHGYEIAKFSSQINYTFETEKEGNKIIILNPVSARVVYEKMGRTTEIDHGMRFGEYKIYTASSFLNALKLDCADKVDSADKIG